MVCQDILRKCLGREVWKKLEKYVKERAPQSNVSHRFHLDIFGKSVGKNRDILIDKQFILLNYDELWPVSNNAH